MFLKLFIDGARTVLYNVLELFTAAPQLAFIDALQVPCLSLSVPNSPFPAAVPEVSYISFDFRSGSVEMCFAGPVFRLFNFMSCL